MALEHSSSGLDAARCRACASRYKGNVATIMIRNSSKWQSIPINFAGALPPLLGGFVQDDGSGNSGVQRFDCRLVRDAQNRITVSQFIVLESAAFVSD